MAGGKPWHQRGTGGSGETIAATDRPEISYLDVSQTTTLASGSTETVEVYAPTGSVYRVKALKAKLPTMGTATAGDHNLRIEPQPGVQAALGKSDYTEDVLYDAMNFKRANQLVSPSSEIAQNKAVAGQIATESNALTLLASNQLDVDNTNDRTWILIMREDSY